ncbi:MAG: hypothetical protein U0451_02320 [Candidatus Saccharimonadales bacterium]
MSEISSPQPGELEIIQASKPDEVQALGEMLNVIKRERKEVSNDQAELIFLGELRGDTNPDHWTGSISLTKRLESGEISSEEVEEAKSRINDCYVSVTIGAPKRCGDGSTIEGYDDNDPEWYGRPLGVQQFGGTNSDAVGRRLKVGYQSGATRLKDVEDAIENHRSEFSAGDHNDVHAEGDGTGCGQIDGEQRRFAIYGDDEKGKTLITIERDLYQKAGLAFPEAAAGQLLPNGKSIHDNAGDYFIDGNASILDLIQSKNSYQFAVERLTRPHPEVFLVLNFVEGTTFHRDHFNAPTNAKIGAFGIDVWDIIKEHGEDAFYVLADTVATGMDLTDGTLQVVARVSK